MKLALVVSLFAQSIMAAAYSHAAPLLDQPSLAISVVQGEKSTDLRDLKLNTPVERDLVSGQTHTYRVALATGQYIHVLVRQPTVDVRLTILDPAGKNIIDANWETKGSTESVWLVAETSGSYQLKVSAIATWPDPRYSIELAKL